MQQIISTLKQFKKIQNNLCLIAREQLLDDIQKYLKENNIVAFRWGQGHFCNDGDTTHFSTRHYEVLIDPSIDILDCDKVDEAFIYYEDVDATYRKVVDELVDVLEDATDSLEQMNFCDGDGVVEITVYRDAESTVYSSC
jgi:hypothetical protein